MFIRLLLCTAVAFVSACASVGTTGVGGSAASGSAHGRGVPYYLPKALFDVSLAAFTGEEGFRDNISIAVTRRFVADDAAGALSLGYSSSLFTADNVTLVPNAQGLLSSVTLQSDSRAAEAFSSLGTLAGSFQSGQTGTLQFSTETLDPTDEAGLAASSIALSNAMRDWAYRQSHVGSLTEDRRVFFATVAQSSLGLEWVWDNARGRSAADARDSAACGRTSVCVRAARPGRLLVWRCGALATRTPRPAPVRGRGGRLIQQDAPAPQPLAQPQRTDSACGRADGILVGAWSLSIPNDGPSVALPVEGGIFADTNHTLALRDGMVSEYRTTRASELEGFGTSAVGLVTAQARAVASGLQTERQRVEAQTALARERINLVDAQRDLEAARTGAAPDNSAAGAGEQGEGEQDANDDGGAGDDDRRSADDGAGGDDGNGGNDGAVPEGGPGQGDEEDPPVIPSTPAETDRREAVSVDSAPASWSAGLFGPLTEAEENEEDEEGGPGEAESEE
jgi:hypothetical protein